jgi:hypothetical protein
MRHSRLLLFGPDTRKLELLMTPLNRLELGLDDGPLGKALAVARADLKRVRIKHLAPNFYLSSGYGTVEGTTNVAVGFYDAHYLLRELHREFRRWLYKPEEIVSTVRHELGHAFCYAYKIYKRKDFRETFHVRGNFFKSYPATNRYVERANPWSRSYVNPLGDHYAQKHPDDDFAETFSVWLTPRLDWRRLYRRFPGALLKLRYVGAIVEELRNREPEVESDALLLDEPLANMAETLATFLKASPVRYRRRAQGYVDPDMRRMFKRVSTQTRASRAYLPAASLIKTNRPYILNRVAAWADVDTQVILDFIEKCGERSQALELLVRRDERESKLLEFGAYVSTHCAYYASSGRFFPE